MRNLTFSKSVPILNMEYKFKTYLLTLKEPRKKCFWTLETSPNKCKVFFMSSMFSPAAEASYGKVFVVNGWVDWNVWVDCGNS